jgi:hypothetical protein
MNTKLVAAIAVCTAFAVTPALAQQKEKEAPAAEEQAGPKLSKADVQKIVDAIKADKAKTKTFCEMASLNQKIEAAYKKNDEKKAEPLEKQLDDLASQLGLTGQPDEDGAKQLDALSKACPK